MPQKTLVIAEKPSVARDIARVLNCRERLEGALSGDEYVVSWAIGHLVSLCEPDELDPAYKKWRMEQLPILPGAMKLKVLPKTKSQFAILKKLMNSREIGKLICATDSGREGELIFRYIYQQAGCKKPVDRLWISSMTDAAIRDGFAKIRPDADYDPLYHSARCRSEADWLVGMNASRAFTLKYDALLSVGRVQTPTLNLIVQRDREIAEFVPKDYHEVRADFGDYQGLWQDPETNELRCYDAELAKSLKRELPGKPAKVVESTREMKRQPPPQLFDLTSLQQEANRLMGLPAAKTLALAQSLYEQRKLITYPRTDSKYLPKDMLPQVKKVLRGFKSEPYASLAAPILDAKTPFGRVINDARVSDHHAIIPTDHKTDLSKLPDPERKLYDMIAKRLIAVHYPDYEYESAIVRTQSEGHTFKTEGATPIALGWKLIYGADESKKDEPKVPPLAVGDMRAVQGIALKALKTKPPAPHTDASLLKMMENAGRLIDDEALQESMKDSGLGTPATRAAILERLVKVGYIQRRGKALNSTDKGRQLIAVTPEEIKSPEMTGRWERALATMAKPHAPEELDRLSDKFMGSIRRYAAFLVDAAKQASAEVVFEKDPARGGKKYAPKSKKLGIPCPLCQQGELTQNQKAFGCTRWREGCKFTIWIDTLKRQGGPLITEDMLKRLLVGERIPTDKGSIVFADGAIKIE